MNSGDLIYAFFTHAGPGGIFVLSVIATAGTIYYMLIRWILQGAEVEEPLTVREARARRQEKQRKRWAERQAVVIGAPGSRHSADHGPGAAGAGEHRRLEGHPRPPTGRA